MIAKIAVIIIITILTDMSFTNLRHKLLTPITVNTKLKFGVPELWWFVKQDRSALITIPKQCRSKLATGYIRPEI